MINDDRLGGRLALARPTDLDRGQRNLYDHIAAAILPWGHRAGFDTATPDGQLIGPFNAFLSSPTIAASYLSLVECEQQSSTLEAAVRELVILCVGAVWRSDYELYAHAAAGRAAGLTDSQVAAVSRQEIPDSLEERAASACRFTLQLCRDHRVTSEVYGDTVSAFGERGVVDMLFLIGNYLTTSALLNALEIPAPEQPPAG